VRQLQTHLKAKIYVLLHVGSLLYTNVQKQR
jgi:hypothetical protein